MYTLLLFINSTKAAGCDRIPTKLIKDGASGLATPLSFLINCSLNESVFSTAEKLAKISPVYKSGDHSLFDNYRPISVLNVLSMVIEKCVYWQLSEYLERSKLLSSSQYGFRQGRSTVHAVTYLTDYIRQNADNGNRTGVLYMDLKKAFDSSMPVSCTNFDSIVSRVKKWIGSRITCLTDGNAWNMTAVNLICIMW